MCFLVIEVAVHALLPKMRAWQDRSESIDDSEERAPSPKNAKSKRRAEKQVDAGDMFVEVCFIFCAVYLLTAVQAERAAAAIIPGSTETGLTLDTFEKVSDVHNYIYYVSIHNSRRSMAISAK